jgi:DNA-binding transcriptional LysR family regulator
LIHAKQLDASVEANYHYIQFIVLINQSEIRMNVTIRHLRAAAGVARYRSFRRAAEAVHLSQPALSLAISELEETLGVVLFDRTSRSVATTELGESFIQGAVRLLADFDGLIGEIGDIAQSRRGKLVVSCVSSIAGRIMPLALQACSERYPQVQVTVRDDVALQVLSAVRSREADFGLTIVPADMSEDMTFEAMHVDRFHFVCPKGHRLASRRNVAWKELDGENLISLSTNSGTHQMVNDMLASMAVEPARNTAVSHLSTVHGMLEVGFGVAVLPEIALPVAGHPTLVSKPLVKPELSRTIGSYQRRDRSLSPAASAFLGVVKDVFNGLSR